MSAYLDSVRKSKNYNNYKLTADKVIRILSDVREERTKSRRRWIWELMQNAKDVPNKYSGVSIEITLTENEFIFRHNGDPFQIENVTGLIQQVSSGKPSDSTNKRITGKFGTGFISTHLLSDIVTVKGILQETGLPPKTFSLELNRRAEKSEDLVGVIEEELDRIEKIDDEEVFPTILGYHDNRTEESYDTTFIYPLESEEAKDAAIIGVEDLSNTLPKTLFFVDELKKVTIINKVLNTIVSYELYENKNDGVFHFPIIKQTIDSAINYLHFVRLRDEILDLAIQVDSASKKRLQQAGKSPRLYRDFPLVGTEQFTFPFTLNGINFFPTEKRDSILLTDTSSKSVIANREILTGAVTKAKQFVEWLVNNNAKSLFLVAQSRIPNQITEPEVVGWYKDNVQVPYRTFLLDQEIVETKNTRISLKNAIIPKVHGNREENEKLWDLLEGYFGVDKVCKKEEITSWQDCLGPDSELPSWGTNIFYTTEDLLREVQSKIQLDGISLVSLTETKITWLNKLFQFIIDTKQTEYFKSFKLIPTVKGTLKSLNDDLFIEKDTKIPNEFIQILKRLKNEDWEDILVHRGVITIDQNHASKSVKDISDEINKILNFEEKNQYGQAQRSFIDRESCELILLDLIAIILYNTSGENFQSKLFGAANAFFSANKNQTHLTGIDGFNFNPAKRQLIKLLNRKIEKAEKLGKLPMAAPEVWLFSYLSQLQANSEFKTLLEIGNIFPNRKGAFICYEEVRAYGTQETPLDDDLIFILKELNPTADWDNFIIHDGFRKLALEPRKLDELAIAIQNELEILRLDNSYSQKSSTILKLIHWCSNNPFEAQKYFGSFVSQKDKIFVNISLDDKDVGGNIVKLLANKEKLIDLVLIAESGINISALSDIALIAQTISIEAIQDLAQQLKDEKDDFEFKRKIGESVEMAFMQAFESINLPYELTYQGVGSQDVIITNPINQRSFFIELKSLSPTNWDKSLKLALSQGKKALEHDEQCNYSIAVLIRPENWEEASIDFIKQNLSSQMKTGAYLRSAIMKNQTFESLLESENEVSLTFEDTRRHIKVSEHFWRTNGRNFDELIQNVRAYLG